MNQWASVVTKDYFWSEMQLDKTVIYFFFLNYFYFSFQDFLIHYSRVLQFKG